MAANSKTGVVSARDLVPDGFAAEGNMADIGSSSVDPSREDIVDDLVYDIFNLTACNYHPIVYKTPQEREEAIAIATTRATQNVIKRLLECPVEQSDIGPLVLLPNQEFILPRALRLKEEKEETKWEKFAREKGIKKTKRERMVYDDDDDVYRPRYGYKSKGSNLIEEMPIMEIKPGDDPYADPWEKARVDKKDRVKKNEKNMLKNQRRAGSNRPGSAGGGGGTIGTSGLVTSSGLIGSGSVGKGGKKGKKGTINFGGGLLDSASMPGIPIEMSEKAIAMKNGKRGKAGLRRALELAQISTASMGRFDTMREGEPTRKLKGKKQSFRDNLSVDKSAMNAQLRIVADKVDKKRKGVTNSLAPYAGIIPDAPSDTFKQRKGKGKARKTGGGDDSMPSAKKRKRA